jgi:Flp pilus assembly protein TadG
MSATSPAARPPRSYLARLRRDEDGATAVEFALIAVPFIMLLFGIISVCLYFFTQLYIEAYVYNASRDIRTGAFSESTGDYATATNDQQRRDKFKELVCNRTPDPGNCLANMQVIIQGYSSGFGSIVRPSCKKADNSLIDSATANGSSTSVGPDQPVLITACYEWKFGGKLPFFKIGNMANGSHLIQASATFRTEPYK